MEGFMFDGFSQAKRSAGKVCKIQGRRDKTKKPERGKNAPPGREKERAKLDRWFRRRWAAFGLAALALLLAAVFYTGLSWQYGAYALCVNGQPVCIVEDEAKGREVIESYLRGKRADHGAAVEFSEEICFEQGFYPDLPSKKTDGDFLLCLQSSTHLQLPAATLVVAGEPLLTLRDAKAAENFLTTYRAARTALPREGAEVASSRFLQDVEIREEVVPLEQVVNDDSAAALCSSSLSGLDVEVVYEYEETVDVDPAQKIVADHMSPKGKRTVSEEGQMGRERIRRQVVEVNGEVVENKVLEREVITAPGTTVILEGTRSPLSLASRGDSSGSEIPMLGQVTARFGDLGGYWQNAHTGLDLAAPYGTPIYAVAAGTVIFAGWNDAYGNLVIVDLGNGTTTYYGHQSKMLVKEGDWLSRGDKLGECGSTGNSSGCHLHFEVRIDDVPVDPQTSNLI